MEEIRREGGKREWEACQWGKDKRNGRRKRERKKKKKGRGGGEEGEKGERGEGGGGKRKESKKRRKRGKRGEEEEEEREEKERKREKKKIPDNNPEVAAKVEISPSPIEQASNTEFLHKIKYLFKVGGSNSLVF